MSGHDGIKPTEGLLMMQELEDRLKEQIDKLEHIRLSVNELKDNLSGSGGDLKQSLADHVDWLGQMTERVENLQMNTAVFVQMNTKPRTWKQVDRHASRWGRHYLTDDAQSECPRSPLRTRRNSDAASDMSCAW